MLFRNKFTYKTYRHSLHHTSGVPFQ